MSGYFAVDPRPIAPDDAQGARLLLLGTLGVTPYVDRAMEVLEAAERGNNREYRAQVIARDGTVAALALYGAILGTDGGARLYTVTTAPGVSATDIGVRLLESVADAAREDGARFLLAEFADDPALGNTLALLRAAGYAEESRVPDFFRDGVALAFWRLNL